LLNFIKSNNIDVDNFDTDLEVLNKCCFCDANYQYDDISRL